MSNYIKREDAIDAVSHEWQIFKGVLAIEHIPSADVVEVVRCKDCKWYIPTNDNYGQCTYRTREHLLNEPTDYCSYGERKDNE